MAKRKASFSGAVFRKRLKPPVALPAGFVGIVKPADDPDFFHFAHPSSCHRWAKIDAAHIAQVESLGKIVCGGHEHELVRLTLTPPESPQAETFKQLADLHHDLALRFTNGAAVAGFRACPDGQHGCWNEATQPWDCCPD